MYFQQTSLPDIILKSFSKILFCHPKHEASICGVYAKLLSDKEISFKTLFIEPTRIKSNDSIVTPRKKDESWMINKDKTIATLINKGELKGNTDNAGALRSAAETMLIMQNTEDQKMAAKP